MAPRFVRGNGVGNRIYKRAAGARGAAESVLDRLVGRAYVASVGRKGTDEYDRGGLRALFHLPRGPEFFYLDLRRQRFGKARVGSDGIDEVAGDSVRDTRLRNRDVGGGFGVTANCYDDASTALVFHARLLLSCKRFFCRKMTTPQTHRGGLSCNGSNDTRIGSPCRAL